MLFQFEDRVCLLLMFSNPMDLWKALESRDSMHTGLSSFALFDTFLFYLTTLQDSLAAVPFSTEKLKTLGDTESYSNSLRTHCLWTFVARGVPYDGHLTRAL